MRPSIREVDDVSSGGKKKTYRKHTRKWCPGWDLNPHTRCRIRDFKSLASADFATRAQ